MPTTFYTSPQIYKQAFLSGLDRILDIQGLGTYILACANASFDPLIFNEMRPRLQLAFNHYQEDLCLTLKEGRAVTAADDDLSVFLKMICIGFSNLQSTEWHQPKGWNIQFNPLRALRPARSSQQRIQQIQQPFNPDAFHFNKPFLQKEAFWTGRLANRNVTLYYNKFPFIDYHLLLLPEREQCLPQQLTEDYHHYAWQISQHINQDIPGTGLAFNSLGALASINHLHFHLFTSERDLPITYPRWQHNGGNERYPCNCQHIDSAEQAWQLIQQLQGNNQAHNLIYQNGSIYIITRKMQGDYQQPAWTSGLSWYELSGNFVTFNRQDFEMLDNEKIRDALGC